MLGTPTLIALMAFIVCNQTEAPVTMLGTPTLIALMAFYSL